ncbi:MAG: Maf family protein [Pyrinomonadaceae bacterium]
MDKEREPQADSTETPEHPGGLRALVLASSSPRRAEILSAVGWPFETCPADIDETMRAGEEPSAYVRRLAREKAGAVAATRLFGLVLGADTVVVIDEEVLGKPRDETDARRMLRLLSGRGHEVLTGIALVRAEDGRASVSFERTHVRFAALSDTEIDWYVSSGEPSGKAGAYAIQGRAALFVEAIEGDYWNVVGLPVRRVYELAREFESAAAHGGG